MAYEVLPFKVFVLRFKCWLRNALHAYTYKELCCQNRSAPCFAIKCWWPIHKFTISARWMGASPSRK